MVPRCLLINSAQMIGRLRNSSGGMMATSRPSCIGRHKKAIMPMSCESGSQLAKTSVLISRSSPSCSAMALAARLPWLISTALGAPVDPDVNCRNAISVSSVSASNSAGSAVRKDSTVQTASCCADR